MSPFNRDLVLLLCDGLLVLFHAYYFWRLWNLPLNNGPGFFLRIEVPSGFYDGPGVAWMKRYRRVVLLVHLISATVLAVILASGRINLSPLWAGSNGILFPTSMVGFTLFARRRLATNLPRHSNVAIALEARRLGDYLSWTTEALFAAIIVLSWLLILTRGDAQTALGVPILLTYVVVGLFPSKVGIVRSGFPLPAERTDEHHRLMEAQRRYSLRVLGSMQWLMVIFLAGYALKHSWRPAAHTQIWFQWLLIGIGIGVWLILVGTILRGEGRLAAMGRDLRPVGSWLGPYQANRLMPAGAWVWSGAYILGLLLLLAWIFTRS